MHDDVTPVRSARTLLWLLLAAVVARGGWVCLQQARGVGLLFPDEFEYWRLAESIAAGRGLVDEFGFRATYMPLYPAFLALFVKLPHGLLLARLAQAAVGAAAVVPVFLLARRLSPDPRAAVLSGLLVALDPFLVFGLSHLMLTETIFTTLLATAILLAWPASAGDRAQPTGRDRQPDAALGRRSGSALYRALAAGAAFALCIYTRPSAAAFVPVWFVALAVTAKPDRRGLGPAIGTLLTAAALLAPWAVRNRVVLGRWRVLSTRSGISLYDGLGPRATGGSDLAYTKSMHEVRGLSETEWDAFFSRESLRMAREDPRRVLRLAATKFLRTWSLVPNEPGSRTPVKMAASAGWMVLTLGMATAGVFRRRRPRETLLLLLPGVYFTLLHMVYVGSVRYRVPAMPPIYVLSGWAVARRADERPSRGADG